MVDVVQVDHGVNLLNGDARGLLGGQARDFVEYVVVLVGQAEFVAKVRDIVQDK